ncbi:MAG: NAD(P)H-binding protein [Bacteroidota bacterium]
MSDSVLVIGAAGRIGRHLFASLLGRDVPVRVFTRDPERFRQFSEN